MRILDIFLPEIGRIQTLYSTMQRVDIQTSSELPQTLR